MKQRTRNIIEEVSEEIDEILNPRTKIWVRRVKLEEIAAWRRLIISALKIEDSPDERD